MKDGLLDFGSLALATKDTKVYSDVLDFGAFDTKSSLTKHTQPQYLDIVFRTAAAFNAADSVQFSVQDSADGTTFADLATGVIHAAPSAGLIEVMQMPQQHRRYVRVAANPTSSGTLTASTVTAYCEFGPNRTN